MEKILIITWLYIGMYGYIYWISKRNYMYHKKWRSYEARSIPMMGVFGPLSFIMGYVLYYKHNRQ